MHEGYLALFIPMILLVGTFIVIVNLRKYQNIERMAMIDKGVDPQFFNIRRPVNTSWALRGSLLLIGAGIGLLLGNVLDRVLNVDEPVAYFSMLFLFGGLGLGGSYLIEEKKLKAEDRK